MQSNSEWFVQAAVADEAREELNAISNQLPEPLSSVLRIPVLKGSFLQYCEFGLFVLRYPSPVRTLKRSHER